MLHSGLPIREDREAGGEKRDIVRVTPGDYELDGWGVDRSVDEHAAKGIADGLLKDEHVVLAADRGLRRQRAAGQDETSRVEKLLLKDGPNRWYLVCCT